MKSPGAPSKLNADHRRALAEVVEAGPVPAVDGVVRWRRKDLARWLLETFAISLDETTVGRELKALGFAKISARPRHYAQNELAVEAKLPRRTGEDPGEAPERRRDRAWWQDEARIGQKISSHADWHAPAGAPRPAHRMGLYLRRDLSREGERRRAMPWSTPTPWRSRSVLSRRSGIVDQAGWHLTPKLSTTSPSWTSPKPGGECLNS